MLERRVLYAWSIGALVASGVARAGTPMPPVNPALDELLERAHAVPMPSLPADLGITETYEWRISLDYAWEPAAGEPADRIPAAQTPWGKELVVAAREAAASCVGSTTPAEPGSATVKVRGGMLGGRVVREAVLAAREGVVDDQVLACLRERLEGSRLDHALPALGAPAAVILRTTQVGYRGPWNAACATPSFVRTPVGGGSRDVRVEATCPDGERTRTTTWQVAWNVEGCIASRVGACNPRGKILFLGDHVESGGERVHAVGVEYSDEFTKTRTDSGVRDKVVDRGFISWTWFAEGDVAWKLFYDSVGALRRVLRAEGERRVMVEVDPSGQVTAGGTLVGGIKHGSWIESGARGPSTWRAWGDYLEGKKDGEWTEVWFDGDIFVLQYDRDRRLSTHRAPTRAAAAELFFLDNGIAARFGFPVPTMLVSALACTGKADRACTRVRSEFVPSWCARNWRTAVATGGAANAREVLDGYCHDALGASGSWDYGRQFTSLEVGEADCVRTITSWCE